MIRNRLPRLNISLVLFYTIYLHFKWIKVLIFFKPVLITERNIFDPFDACSFVSQIVVAGEDFLNS